MADGDDATLEYEEPRREGRSLGCLWPMSIHTAANLRVRVAPWCASKAVTRHAFEMRHVVAGYAGSANGLPAFNDPAVSP
jgi:hypothetical protein